MHANTNVKYRVGAVKQSPHICKHQLVDENKVEGVSSRGGGGKRAGGEDSFLPS